MGNAISHPPVLEIGSGSDIYLRLATAKNAAEIKKLYVDNVDFIAQYNYGWTDTSPEAVGKKVDKAIQSIENGKTIDYLIFQKDGAQEKVIGLVGFYDINPDQNTAFISYMLAEQYTGQGYAKAAAQRLMEYGVTALGFTKISLEIDPDNMPSKKISEALNAHPAGEIYMVEEAGRQFPNQKWEVDFE